MFQTNDINICSLLSLLHVGTVKKKQKEQTNKNLEAMVVCKEGWG